MALHLTLSRAATNYGMTCYPACRLSDPVVRAAQIGADSPADYNYIQGRECIHCSAAPRPPPPHDAIRMLSDGSGLTMPLLYVLGQDPQIPAAQPLLVCAPCKPGLGRYPAVARHLTAGINARLCYYLAGMYRWVLYYAPVIVDRDG